MVPWLVAILSSSGVGLLLATHRARNPIGWLLLANGLILAFHALVSTYVNYAVQADPGALPGGEWAVLLEQRTWPTLFVTFTAVAFIFPDGRLVSPRWRPMAVVAAVSYAVLIVVSLFA